MRKISLLFIFGFTLLFATAQETFRQKFLEANTLLEDNLHNVALPILQDLLTEQPDNNNVNYKVGLCYIYSANEKMKAMDYLEKAAKNTTSNYDPFSTSEDDAPIETFFYLAKAYHINYEIDSAIASYTTFKEKITKKHYLFEEVDHHMAQCLNAKEAMKNPVNIIVNSLGGNINTEFPEYGPVISLDESTIYFTSRRLRADSSNYLVKDAGDGQYFEDIYVSYNIDGAWSAPELLNINTTGHEADVNMSLDGQTLFIYKDDEMDGNLYSSRLEGEIWSTPVKLGSDINLKSQESHVHISPDGSTLYFISDRKNGLGGSDIYQCKKLPNGEWALAQNMGDVLNTKYDEDGVFIHPDGKTMYFSSKGHKSIGGFDVFQSKMDDQGNWTAPVNLGYPVNSTDDDVFFVTSADGKRGYYSSFQEKGFGDQDIYVISMADAEEIPLTLLTGHIKVIGEDLPENALITVNRPGLEKPFEYRPRKRDGKFSIILQPGHEYHIEYVASKYKKEEDLYIPPIAAYQELNRSIDLQDVIFGAPSTVVDNGTTTNDTNTTDTNSNNTDNTSSGLDNSTYVSSVKEVASYQEFFNYNNKDVNVSNPDYVNMIDEAVKHAKSAGKVTINIESSASKVPTRTYGTNIKLANKRANDAVKVVEKSLLNKGLKKESFVIKVTAAAVQGPKYKNDFKNTKIYEKYQYVIVKVK